MFSSLNFTAHLPESVRRRERSSSRGSFYQPVLSHGCKPVELTLFLHTLFACVCPCVCVFVCAFFVVETQHGVRAGCSSEVTPDELLADAEPDCILQTFPGAETEKETQQ